MTLITKPDFTYVWASGGAVVAPNDTKKQQGWIAEAPPFQYDNWLQNRQDQMLAHINQRGIPAWDALTNYEASSLSYVQGSTGEIYKSVAASGPAATVQNPVTDTLGTYWTKAFSTTNPSPSASNLKMTVASASASTTITADEVILATALGGLTYKVSNYSKVVNLGTVGAGGMDVGSAPANGYVALYAIYNPTSRISALLAKNATSGVQTEVYSGANMPAGYTASALITVLPTNGSGQFKVSAVQGRKVYLPVTSLFSGSAINANTSISAAVPPNAIELTSGELILQNTANSAMSLTVASNVTVFLGQQNSTALLSAGASLSSNFTSVPLTTAQSIGIVGSSSAGTPTYSVYVTGYSI